MQLLSVAFFSQFFSFFLTVSQHVATSGTLLIGATGLWYSDREGRYAALSFLNLIFLLVHIWSVLRLLGCSFLRIEVAVAVGNPLIVRGLCCVVFAVRLRLALFERTHS